MEAVAPARAVLEYAGLAIAAEASDPRDLAWLLEFLCPWFGAADEPETGPNARAVLVRDAAAFEAALERGPVPRATPVPAFVGDGRPLALEPWSGASAHPLYFDQASQAFFEVGPDRRSCRVLAPPGQRFARVAWMRAVRELATEPLIETGRPLLHASAVAVTGRAIAFAGHRRSGKTSCLLHALRDPGAGFLANDRLAVLPGEPWPTARGMPTIVRLRPDSLDVHPSFAPRRRARALRVSDALGEARDGRPAWPRPDGSLGLSPAQFLDRIDAKPVVAAPLAAIVLPWISHEPGRFELTRLAAEAAARRLPAALLGSGELAPETLFSAPGADRAAAAAAAAGACAELAQRVPCFDLRLDRDAFAGAPGALLEQVLAPCG
jgi:hypothetical protein